MPTTVKDIFERHNLSITEKVHWGQNVGSTSEGIYVVAIANNENELSCFENAPLCETSITNWIAFVKTNGSCIMVDKEIAAMQKLRQRLSELWHPDETILYIGKVESGSSNRNLRKQVLEYYETKLGCSRKHSGGNWVNTLTILPELYVYCSACQNPALIEEEMITYFQANVSNQSCQILYDKEHCYPFANKELNKSQRKKHGITNQTVDCGRNWRR